MKQLVNKNLITLKCVLFCFLGGVGCIYPFLPLHMLAVGLERGEARLVSAVAPCIALLGPAIFGPLVDKLSVGRGSTGGQPGASSGSGRLLRILTALCLVLSAIFYLLILAVPTTQRFEARRPRVLFMCDEHVAIIKQEVCIEGTKCSQWDGEKAGVLAVTQCESGHVDANMTWMEEYQSPTTTTELPIDNNTQAYTTEPDEDDESYEENPPHLCTNGVCHVYMRHEQRLLVPLTLSSPQPPDENETLPTGSAWCTYRSENAFHCDVLQKHNNTCKECRSAIRCQVLDPYDQPGGVLAEAECRVVNGDPVATFWSYFILRCLADVWPTAALALLGAACVIATRETSLGRGDVGRQLAVGTLGLAIFAPLAGLAVRALGGENFVVPFVLHAILMLIAALILIFDGGMPLSTPEWWWHTATGVLTLPMNAVRRYGAETAGLFIVITLLGVLCSAIDSYLPWTIYDLEKLEDKDWIPVVAGVTTTVGALSAVPFLWWAEAVVDFIGHSNLLITAFIFYCMRYVALAATTNTDWVLASEALEVFTMSLVWVTAVLYFRHLVPRKYTTTGQALPVIAHFCIGRCIGALIGGLVISLEDEVDSVRTLRSGLAITALLAAAVYLALYHLLLAPRCAARPMPPHHTLLQGLNTNGASNGSYSPMRVYHEERSRKGHFRY